MLNAVLEELKNLAERIAKVPQYEDPISPDWYGYGIECEEALDEA